MVANSIPEVVTRYIDRDSKMDLNLNRANSSAFFKLKNPNQISVEGIISVFDIDEELRNDDVEGIYRLSDTFVYRRSHAIARADLNVKSIQEIPYKDSFLSLERVPTVTDRHCHITNFPDNVDDANNIANILAFKSRLHIRNS